MNMAAVSIHIARLKLEFAKEEVRLLTFLNNSINKCVFDIENVSCDLSALKKVNHSV